MSSLVGTLLGRYEILGAIGRGTMGAVYRARDPHIDRIVAIKTICLAGQEAADEREYRKRFFQEARAAGSLSHPGIVTVFDVGEELGSDPYIVMEYVAGSSLDHFLGIADKKLPIEIVLQLIQEIAEALDCAHRHGVIHRDVKPANILVTADGHSKIADFGIAKLNQSQLTMPGVVFGSPAYMAPEQLSGETTDGRADLFSLGVILYTLLTGHRPFQGNSVATVAFKLANRAPLPVAAMDAQIPQDFDPIVLRAIAKDPAARYQSGREMADAIRGLREKHDFLADQSPKLASWMTNFLTKQEARDSGINLRGNFRPVQSGPSVPLKVLPPLSGLLDRRLFAIVAFGAIITFLIAVAPGWRGGRPSEVDSPPMTSPTNSATVPIEPLPTTRARPLHKKPLGVVQLDVAIEHHFASGQASIWLDDKLVYSQVLKGETKTHALLFSRTKGSTLGKLRVEPGEHEMRVRVRSTTESYDNTQMIAGTFISGDIKTLRVSCDKNRLQLALR